MRLEQFDPRTDHESLRACHLITEVARPIDHPHLPPQSLDGFVSWWAHGGGTDQSWLARDELGEPVACGLLTLSDRDNPTRAGCAVVVHPARRRNGIGSALLTHCAVQARAHGRGTVASTELTRTKVRDGSAGAAFAASVGATTGLVEFISTHYIDAEVLDRLASLRADAMARSTDYEPLSWRGATPEHLIDEVARVNGAMSDAPRDAGVSHETRDTSAIRKSEAVALESGLHLYSVAARHRGTGEFAALTQMTTDPQTPGWALQQVTAVLPRHRGHRLGLLVKIEMVELLIRLEPDVRRILTGNAASNAHMLAINAQLGYEISDAYRSWHVELSSG
jgi:GNAT superfamily N-acetyltransferase